MKEVKVGPRKRNRTALEGCYGWRYLRTKPLITRLSVHQNWYSHQFLCRRSQNLAELLLLRRRQRNGELDVVLDDEVAALPGLLRDGHAERRIYVGAAGLRGARFLKRDVLAVNSSDCAFPSGQGFLEVQVDGLNEIVTVARVQRMWFL